MVCLCVFVQRINIAMTMLRWCKKITFPFPWDRMKNGVEVPTGVRSRYRVKSEGTKHWLVIDDAMKDDTGTYSVMATGGTSEARVQVDCEHNLFLFLYWP